MSTNFFADALRKAMAARHFNQAQLAEHLGVDPAYVSRWLKGSSPRIDQMRGVLSTLGWDLERARPDYDPFEDAIHQIKQEPEILGDAVAEAGADYSNLTDIKDLLEGAAETHKRLSHPPILLNGEVDAASAQIKFQEKGKPKSFDTFGALFPQLDYADNEMTMLLVKGNDLAPAYYDGTNLVLRRVLKASAVPEGSVVVFEAPRKPGGFHLRRLVRVLEKRSGRVDRVIGAPISPRQDYLFFKPREAKVHSIVVGAIAGIVSA